MIYTSHSVLDQVSYILGGKPFYDYLLSLYFLYIHY